MIRNPFSTTAPAPRRAGRLRRALATVLAAAVGTAVAVLPGSPALATLPSGTGWAASWDYYTTTSFEYHATLPGVELYGYGTDNSGTRTTVGSIEDTSSDGRCARVLIYAAGAGYIVDQTTCGNGTYLTYSTGGFSGNMLIMVYRMYTGGSASYDKSFYMPLPSSVSDPGLRTVGTGTSWNYYTATSFQYSVKRSGVSLVGYGSHQALDQRSALSTVTSTALNCVTGETKDYNSAVTGGACVNGSQSFSTFDFDGWIEPKACATPIVLGGGTATTRCLGANIPEPY